MTAQSIDHKVSEKKWAVGSALTTGALALTAIASGLLVFEGKNEGFGIPMVVAGALSLLAPVLLQSCYQHSLDQNSEYKLNGPGRSILKYGYLGIPAGVAIGVAGYFALDLFF